MEHLANKDNETLGINDLTALQTLLEKDLELLFNIISQTDNKEIIFVSDELGMGIVPANAMSRVYRDLVGLAISMWPKRQIRYIYQLQELQWSLKAEEWNHGEKNCQKSYVSGNKLSCG